MNIHLNWHQLLIHDTKSIQSRSITIYVFSGSVCVAGGERKSRGPAAVSSRLWVINDEGEAGICVKELSLCFIHVYESWSIFTGGMGGGRGINLICVVCIWSWGFMCVCFRFHTTSLCVNTVFNYASSLTLTLSRSLSLSVLWNSFTKISKEIRKW